MAPEGTTLTFQVDPGPPWRLDRYLVERDSGLSRSRWQGLIREGCVQVDGRTATKTGQIVEAGQKILVHLPAQAPTRLQPEPIPLRIVFENQDLLVLNKPAGLVVHPAPGHPAGTLVNAVLGHDPEIEGLGGEGRPGIVHRLDKDTSGLIVVAKNDRAHLWLQNQFKTRAAKKSYLALVEGRPPTPSGRIETEVGRDPRNRKRMAVLRHGRRREAVTEYRTVESFAGHTLLEVRPLTGRTHQIRVHCSFLGCPIVGDRIYGRRQPGLGLGRHFLHAARLTLTLPGANEPSTFEAPLPDELEAALRELRNRTSITE